MTRSNDPNERLEKAPGLTAHGADQPRQTVSILSDLSPAQARLTPIAGARPGRWKWVLPPVLTALIGGGLLLGRQEPGPTPEAPPPAAPPAASQAPPLPATRAGTDGGAIIRESPPPPPAPGMPDTTVHRGESVSAHPPPRAGASPRPPSVRPATAQPGQAAPSRAIERDVDIITAIVK